MMILFQSRIIYMPYLPLGARQESLSTYAPLCRPLTWSQTSLRTSDGHTLALASASAGSGPHSLLVVYFQGNCSSTPPRTPILSSILLAASQKAPNATITLLCPSYRGYWGSTGTPNQRGIVRDLEAVFSHVKERRPDAVVLWGQSIGCGILAAGVGIGGCTPRALVLETPFLSVQEMLKALYPQRWLPYRYLGWALWNRWELVEGLGAWRGRVMVLEAGADELVPEGQAERVVEAMGGELVRVNGALHGECLRKPKGRAAVEGFLGDVAKELGEGEVGYADTLVGNVGGTRVSVRDR